MIRVHKRPFIRKGYIKKGRYVNSSRVKETTYMMKDRGHRGKGKPLFPRDRIKKGMLGEDFFDKPLSEEKAILNKKAKRLGEKPVQGQLQFVANINKNTDPKISKKAQHLRTYVAGSFIGHKKVPYPKGLK